MNNLDRRLDVLSNIAQHLTELKTENAQLKELNQKMYNTLKDLHFYLLQLGSVDSLLRNALYQEQETAVRKMLVKAEGRGLNNDE